MQHTHNLGERQVPLLGICDPARHHLRPVITAWSKGVGSREEFEILMVCSRCGYARDARQLQQASEQLVLDVLEEVEQESTETADGTEEETGASSSGNSERRKNNDDTKSGSGSASRKKLN